MSTKIINLDCPDYQFSDLDLEKVSKCIDSTLIANFADKRIILRAIQSEKHATPKDELIQKVIKTGYDRFEADSSNQVKVNDKHIDLFGLDCTVEGSVSLPILEGFHRWKPKSLERPQLRLDIWMIFDADKLDNVEYHHSHYDVIAKDGYKFKDESNKADALTGLLIIN